MILLQNLWEEHSPSLLIRTMDCLLRAYSLQAFVTQGLVHALHCVYITLDTSESLNYLSGYPNIITVARSVQVVEVSYKT